MLALPEIQAVLPIDGVISYVQRHDDFLLNREDDSQIRGDTDRVNCLSELAAQCVDFVGAKP